MKLKLTKNKGIKKRSISHQTFTVFLFFLLMMGYISDFAGPSKVAKAPVTVIIPPIGEKAYSIAGEEFVSLWEKITGQKLAIEVFDPAKPELPSGDLVLIGSDAVSPVVHDLIRSGALETLNIEYGSDDYRMLTLQQQGRRILILAGGSGRSTIYAVYDFFQHQAGVGYFWDGDVINHQDSIALNGIDVLERPHFEYRGLRYFAHRGLHRFQAEHWDLDDWKKEIDWIMKKRFNVFMIRTGIDDLFQRAFPDVPYPPTDAPDPDAKPRSFEDRTSFWPLKYRGELRKQVLQYGRDRGLLNPVDVGTITHWYSSTPLSFYKNRPDFPVIKDQKSGYSLPQDAIWDIESQKAWNAYWHLTATDISEFEGGSARLFHTIGMAERTFGKTARENLQSKLYVYRKTEQMVRQHYPDAPLLVASWDFGLWWKNEDVRNLLKEFNPQKTIILDYVADVTDKVSYKDWGFYKKFPWIFGALHSFDRNSDIHEDYNILSHRLKEASEDSIMCKGLVAWSEISHDDTYFLEYIADNSWNPNHLNEEDFNQYFCQHRYPQAFITKMQGVWKSFLPISQSANWCIKAMTPGYLLFAEPQFRVLTSNQLINLTPDLANRWKSEYERLTAGLRESQVALKRLAGLTDKLYTNPFWRRDALDIARTIASRALFASMARGVSQMEEWQQRSAEPEEVRKYAQVSQDLLASLSDILSMSDDFSMYASLLKLSDAKEIDGIEPTLNPHTELTLKGNAENNYCRSQQYELVQYVYRSEYKAFWKWVLNRIAKGDHTAWNRPSEFDTQEKSIVDKFYKTPLKEMAPTNNLRNAKEMSQSLLHLEKIIEKLNSSQ